MHFFSQDDISKLRPLGKIVGLVLRKKKEEPKQIAQKEPEGENLFHQMANFRPKDSENDSPDEMLPLYDPPLQFMKSLIHVGTMKRIR